MISRDRRSAPKASCALVVRPRSHVHWWCVQGLMRSVVRPPSHAHRWCAQGLMCIGGAPNVSCALRGARPMSHVHRPPGKRRSPRPRSTSRGPAACIARCRPTCLSGTERFATSVSVVRRSRRTAPCAAHSKLILELDARHAAESAINSRINFEGGGAGRLGWWCWSEARAVGGRIGYSCL
jgi:hypothetical protein